MSSFLSTDSEWNNSNADYEDARTTDKSGAMDGTEKMETEPTAEDLEGVRNDNEAKQAVHPSQDPGLFDGLLFDTVVVATMSP